jgi:predicted dehydrogenase
MKLKKGVKRIYPVGKKLKWGIAGCGNFTENTFIPTLLQLKRNTITSIYSSNNNRAKDIANKYSVESYHSNYKEFLLQDFDVIYIGSANNDHHWQTIEAAEFGKHILCEKPIALDSQQAEEMLNACKRNEVFLSVNYVHRFHPLSVKAKNIIDKSLIGSIISISASFNIDYEPNDNFRFDLKQSGGGAFRDLGTHMIDVLRFFGGEIVDIKGC